MINYRQPFRGEFPISQGYGVTTGTDANGHTGIDYACPEGTEILASADGVVMFSQFDSTGYGNAVIIQHNDGKSTVYAHLSKINVVQRQKVNQSDVIGLSGNTGNSTGPHLHFEARSVWYDFRKHEDPVTFLPLMSFPDIKPVPKPDTLIGADSFQEGDLLKVQNVLGVKAFYGKQFADYTGYPQNTPFYYTGESTVRKSNGLTYMRCVPATFSVWIAVNDGDVQLLDKAAK